MLGIIGTLMIPITIILVPAYLVITWLGLSSFKTQAGLLEFPPSLLPSSQKEVSVSGYDKPLPLFTVILEDGSTRVLAQARRIGLQAQMIDPAEPAKIIRVALDKRTPLRETAFAWSNYTEPLKQFDFLRYLGNSVFVTVVATLITLVINSMAAYALSIY